MLKNIKILLTQNQKKQCLFLFIGSIIASFFELIGIGSIPVFAMIIVDLNFLISKLPSFVDQSLFDQFNQNQVALFGGITRRPKPLTKANQNLQNFITETGNLLGIDVAYRATGGVCDGNNLSQSGLPNVDTLGVRGGDIHSINEYMVIDSLAERTRFVALILMRMAQGEFDFIRDRCKFK